MTNKAENPASRDPDHSKVSTIAERMQIIRDFLDGTMYVLAEYRNVDGFNELVPVQSSNEEILADHFGMDLDSLNQEKRARVAAAAQELQAPRAQQSPQTPTRKQAEQ